MKPVLKLIRWAGTKRWFAVMGRHLLTPLDNLLRKRKRSVTGWATGLPMGYLTTVGRSTGEPRTAPLLYLLTATQGFAIVGTNFGGDRHPQWTSNLLANPQARWKVDEEVPVVAREVTEDEYGTLWPRFVEMWPGYADYVTRSQRTPMMFVLETT